MDLFLNPQINMFVNDGVSKKNPQKLLAEGLQLFRLSNMYRGKYEKCPKLWEHRQKINHIIKLPKLQTPDCSSVCPES